MEKSRLKLSSLVLLPLAVLLMANIAITPASAAVPSPPNINSILPTGGGSNAQTTPPPQQTPTSQSQQPSSSQPQQTSTSQTTDNKSDTSHPTPPQSTPTNSPNTPQSAPSSAQVSEIVKSTTDGNGNNVVYTTLTSYSPVPTGIPPSAGSANSLGSNGSSSSDSSGNVVTAAIVVGVVVIVAALGIWIFRKWKLSPSRDFKEKIQPVDFSPSRDHNSDTVFLRELNEP